MQPIREYVENGVRVKVYPPMWATGAKELTADTNTMIFGITDHHTEALKNLTRTKRPH